MLFINWFSVKERVRGECSEMPIFVDYL